MEVGYARFFVTVEDFHEVRGMSAAAEESVYGIGAVCGYDVAYEADHRLRDAQSRNEHRDAWGIRHEELRGYATFCILDRHKLAVA